MFALLVHFDNAICVWSNSDFFILKPKLKTPPRYPQWLIYQAKRSIKSWCKANYKDDV